MQNYKSNIVLEFMKPGDDGKDKVARVTLNNVRTDLTSEEIKQVAQTFESLITYPLGYYELVQFVRFPF